MVYRFVKAFALITMISSPALGQGLMDSVLGAGGLGLWGGGTQQSVLNTFNSPQFYGAPMARPGQYSAPGQSAQQGQAPAQNNYQQPQPVNAQNYYHPNVYSNGKGLYPDWYDVGPGGYPTGQANQQPVAPQQNQAIPQNQPAQQNNNNVAQPPQANYQPQTQSNPNMAQNSGQPPNSQANQRPDLSNDPENLPSGAVKIITTTPEGTTVQYYAPQGGAAQYPANSNTLPQNQAPTRPSARGLENQPTSAAPNQQGQDRTTTRIARPSPTARPSSMDPRQSFGSGVSQGPPKNPFSP